MCHIRYKREKVQKGKGERIHPWRKGASPVQCSIDFFVSVHLICTTIRYIQWTVGNWYKKLSLLSFQVLVSSTNASTSSEVVCQSIHPHNIHTFLFVCIFGSHWQNHLVLNFIQTIHKKLKRLVTYSVPPTTLDGALSFSAWRNIFSLFL